MKCVVTSHTRKGRLVRRHIRIRKSLFGKKDKTEYYELDSPEYKELARYNNPESKETYGKVTKVSGHDLGNALIVSDVALPSGGILTGLGIAARRKLDNLKYVHPDETGSAGFILQGKGD